MWKFLFVTFVVIFLFVGAVFRVFSDTRSRNVVIYPEPARTFWTFQSIDTMKLSRDLAREKLHDTAFDSTIDQVMVDIAGTGATHVAIATPYDDEFVPFLKRWVLSARQHGLQVWFRGNWSGWEQWFDYPSITRDEHIEKTRRFLSTHASLFEDGDIFSPCPECENGGPGDPRANGDVAGYRKFLIDEYSMMTQVFSSMKKSVVPGFFSMNGDVARLAMDRATTAKTGGFITVDHYVKSPEKLEDDVKAFASSSGGKVVLGEFGAPIPDIHGSMSQSEQSAWLSDVLFRMSKTPEVFGMNYWTNTGSSTAIWDAPGKPRDAVRVLTLFFKPQVFSGAVLDELGRGIAGATVSVADFSTVTRADGYFELRAPVADADAKTLHISVAGYLPKDIPSETASMTITLSKEHEDWWFRLEKWVKGKLN